MKDETYSTREVARMVGVAVQTVQRWVDAGHIRAWKTVGGHRRLDRASVMDFIQSLREGDLPTAASADKGLVVLLVDDDPGDIEIARHYVKALRPDAEVIEAENGFAGLVRLGQRRVDVLITDITMPHMDGVQMLRTLASDPEFSDLRIAAMSSYSPDEVARLGPLPDNVPFLPKPLNRAVLAPLLS